MLDHIVVQDHGCKQARLARQSDIKLPLNGVAADDTPSSEGLGTDEWVGARDRPICS